MRDPSAQRGTIRDYRTDLTGSSFEGGSFRPDAELSLHMKLVVIATLAFKVAERGVDGKSEIIYKDGKTEVKVDDRKRSLWTQSGTGLTSRLDGFPKSQDRVAAQITEVLGRFEGARDGKEAFFLRHIEAHPLPRVTLQLAEEFGLMIK